MILLDRTFASPKAVVFSIFFLLTFLERILMKMHTVDQLKLSSSSATQTEH